MSKKILMWMRQYGISVAIFFVVLSFMLTAIPSAVESGRTEQMRVAEESVRRAMVTCYALEGRYPPNIAYLREHYGLQLSEETYAVHYEIFAENIMPEITVVER